MNDLRVVLYSKYSRRGASSRLRTLQYLPLLARESFTVEVCERFSDSYLEARYRKHRLRLVYEVAKSYWRRVLQLLSRRHSNLSWIEGELFPKVPYCFEWMLGLSRGPYVVDYDDALFHNYDLAKSPIVRLFLSHKIDKVMRGAACVIAGNDYLAARAFQAGAKRVEIVPTVVDITRYAMVTHTQHGKPVIGWIGSPSTEKYLLAIAPTLRKVCKETHASLLLVGASDQVKVELADIPLEIVSWSESTEAANIRLMDIGIMPLSHGPWERGKCGYKLIQYMASGLPVVASSVGVNVDIVRDGVNGFLADDPFEWEERLCRLARDTPLRRQMGSMGRERVVKEFCLQVQAPRLARILRRAVLFDSVKGD